MRLSVDENDHSYNPENASKAYNCKVFLNGVEQKTCITADEEAGTIYRFKTIDGKILVNGAGEAEKELLFGKVKIVLDAK